MLANYVSVGLCPDMFWRVTLREYFVHLTGAGQRLEREHKDRAWHAHTVATLSRIDGKKFPKLESLTKKKQALRSKSPSQMLAIAKQWDAAINQVQ